MNPHPSQNPALFMGTFTTANFKSLEDIGPLCVSQKVQASDMDFFQDSSSNEKPKETKTKLKKHESCLMKDSQVAQIKKVKPINKTRQLLKNDDAQVKQALSSALQKEQKVKDKMHRMMNHVEKNHGLANEWFSHQTLELDQYFEEIKCHLLALVTQTLDQERNKLQSNLKQNFEDFSQDSKQISSLFKNLLQDKNSFSNILDQTKTKSMSNPYFEEMLNGYLVNSCDIRFGFTPLVKKYHLFKEAVPSLDPLLHLQERFIISKISLLKEAQNTTNEFSKILQQLTCSVDSRIKRLTNPLKPFIEPLNNSFQISNSMFSEDLFIPISDAPEIDLDSLKDLITPKEVSYNVPAEEKQVLVEMKLVNNRQDPCEMSYDVRSFSTQNDMKKGVFISYNGIPYKILALDWVFPSHYVELENIITRKTERIQFHSRWHQIPFTIIPKRYTIVKSKENKQYYIVCSQKKEMIFSLIEKKNVMNDEITKEIERRFREGQDGKVQVETIKLNDQDIIISIN